MKETIFSQFFNKFSYPLLDYEKCFFNEAKTALEDYSNGAVKPNMLIQILTKKTHQKELTCLDALLKPINVYIDCLFSVVHSGFGFAVKSDIPVLYFDLLKSIAGFLLMVRQENLEKFNQESQSIYSKIILIFNSWGVITSKNSLNNDKKNCDNHHILAKQYFDLLSLDSQYDSFLYFAYVSCSRTTTAPFLKKVFTRMSELTEKNTTKLNETDKDSKSFSSGLFSTEQIRSESTAYLLNKQKTA